MQKWRYENNTNVYCLFLTDFIFVHLWIVQGGPHLSNIQIKYCQYCKRPELTAPWVEIPTALCNWMLQGHIVYLNRDKHGWLYDRCIVMLNIFALYISLLCIDKIAYQSFSVSVNFLTFYKLPLWFTFRLLQKTL